MTDIAPRRTGGAVSYRAARTLNRLNEAAGLERAAMQTIVNVGEFAIYGIEEIRDVQRMVEHRNPDVADSVADIVRIVERSVARRVARFASEIGMP